MMDDPAWASIVIGLGSSLITGALVAEASQ